MAAKVLTLSFFAASTRNGHSRGECLSHPSGRRGACQRVHAEPSAGSVVVPLQGAIGKGFGAGGCCTSKNAAAGSGGAQRCLGDGGAGALGGGAGAGCGALVWHWPEADGGTGAVGQGYRLPTAGDHRARRKGREGPGDLAAHESDASIAGAFTDGSQPASRRPGGWLGPCADALCPGPEVPKRQSGVGVAVGVPPAEAMARQGFRMPGPPSSRSERGAEGGEASRSRSRARTYAPFRSCWATRT